MTSDNIIFPYYSGNIKLTKVMGHVTLNRFVKANSSPKPENISVFELIRNCSDPIEKRKLKHKLFAFTPSVYISKTHKRKYSGIQKYTGLMQIDLDGINNEKIAEDLKQWLFDQPECVCSFFSPSKNVKGLIRITAAKTKDQYIRLHNAITEKYEETGYFDVATRNAVLPLFLSYDPDILYRDYSEATPWTKEKEIKVEHVALNNGPPTNFNSSIGNQGYFKKRTLRILHEKINKISDNGHPQVRSASLILGSRVGANYLSRQEAIIEITSLIKQNQYLSKGIEGYLKTAEWGISQGLTKPKYY